MGAVAMPEPITVRGRLSYPIFGYAEAVERDAKGMYPKQDKGQVKPSFNLLLEEAQVEKVVAYLLEFLPFTVDTMGSNDPKSRPRNGLLKKEADKIQKLIESGDWSDQPPYIPLKVVSEKTADLAPEAAASLKVVGTAGQDIEQRAIVLSESELLVPDPDLTIPSKGMILPIGQTTHELYPGCVAMATVHAYSYAAGPNPGINISAGTCVFKADADRFGGGPSIDEDAMLLDD